MTLAIPPILRHASIDNPKNDIANGEEVQLDIDIVYSVIPVDTIASRGVFSFPSEMSTRNGHYDFSNINDRRYAVHKISTCGVHGK